MTDRQEVRYIGLFTVRHMSGRRRPWQVWRGGSIVLSFVAEDAACRWCNEQMASRLHDDANAEPQQGGDGD